MRFFLLPFVFLLILLLVSEFLNNFFKNDIVSYTLVMVYFSLLASVAFFYFPIFTLVYANDSKHLMHDGSLPYKAYMLSSGICLAISILVIVLMMSFGFIIGKHPEYFNYILIGIATLTSSAIIYSLIVLFSKKRKAKNAITEQFTE